MVPGPMDGKSSPRGRHRHRADPRGAATTDGSPQWSPPVSRPHRTPSAPQWTGAASTPEWTPAPPAPRPESWFGGPDPSPAPRPTPTSHRRWSTGAADQPTQSWPAGAADRPAQSWSVGAADRPAQARPAGAADRPAHAWPAGAADRPAQSWPAGAAGQPATRQTAQWPVGAAGQQTGSADPARRTAARWDAGQPADPWSREAAATAGPGADPDPRSRQPWAGAPDSPAAERGAAERGAADRWAAECGAAERWAAERGAAEPAPATGRVPDPWAGAPAPDGAPVGAGAAPRRGVRHPVRLALYALVIFGLVAGSVAWMAVDKSVRLSVDGEARTVSTYASTVAGVLDDAGVPFSSRDLLAPSAETRVSDGAEIVLRRGRLLRLTIDGKSREVWVHATTVQEALDQVGFRQSGLFLSATRSERLPLEGYDLTVRTPKTVTVLADGRRQRVVTTAATVGQALDEAGVTVDGDDKVSRLATAPVVSGMTITITRVTRKTTTTRTVLEYDTVEKEDPDAAVGSREVTTKGVPGLQQVTYVETYIDGKLTSRKVAKVTVLKQPVDEVVVVGPEPPPAQPAGCEDFPTTGGLNWCGLAQCESGLNPNAYNPAGPYYGLYQFDVGTWQANGGTGTPSGKSIAEQTRVAYNLYLARGRAPWPTCGRYL